MPDVILIIPRPGPDRAKAAVGLAWGRSRQLGVSYVEFPESRRHPHDQMLLAGELTGVVVTYSDHLVSQYGIRRVRGIVEDVMLLIDSPEEGWMEARFDGDGVLHGWPVGYLSP